jgi:apolipoprotein N-acyltransferase
MYGRTPSRMGKKLFGVSRGDAGLAAISGLLLTASFPKVDWQWLAWIALIPFFGAIKGHSPRAGLKLGFLTGLVHYTTLLYWVVGVMATYGQLPILLCWLILALLVVYLSLYPAVFAMVISRGPQTSPLYFWCAPFLWAGLEYIRAFLLSGFPWENLGCSQYNRLHLIQISDILGVYGLSALIVAVNAALFELWDAASQKRPFAWKPMLATACVMAGVLVYGAWRVARVDRAAEAAPKRVVSLVQGNIDQSVKWVDSFQGETLNRYGNLSLEALVSRPDLIIWPETALPFYFLRDEALSAQVLALVRTCGVYFLVGSPSFRTYGSQIHYYNSAFLLGPSGDVLGQYDKVHLVPYGEYVPLKPFFPFLGKIVEAVGNFESGEKGQVLSWKTAKLGVLICFEVIFPELARAMAQNGAQLLVNITNDAWFGTSSAPYQHLSMAVFRAVENHRALARAANTGISAFVDPVGRLLDETPLYQEAVRTRAMPMMGQKTFYTSHGDLFAIGCLLISLILCINLFRNRKP